MQLLMLAFYLSVLTYYTGVLIYTIPLPFYGLKKWAPQLMIDGVFSAILVFSYTILLWLINYIGYILGVDWGSFNKWFTEQLLSIASLLVTLRTLGLGLSSVGLGFLTNSFISPLISSLTYLMIFISTYYILSVAIASLAPILISIGLVLHSIPFRLARGGGATLIAVAMVFSIGAPLTPFFVETIGNYELVNRFSYGYLLADIFVYDSIGNAIPYYVYEIYSLDNALLARYASDQYGYVNATSIDKGVPSSKHIVRISMAGYFYETIVTPSSPLLRNITLTCLNAISLRPLRMVSVFNMNTFTVNSISSNYVIMTTYSSTDSTLVAIGLSSDAIVAYVDDEPLVPSRTYSYTWRNVDFRTYEYVIPNGSHTVFIGIYGSEQPTPSNIDEIYYARDTLGVSIGNLEFLVQPVSALVLKLFIAPVVYVSILVSTSVGLAKLLGGSSIRVARILVTGI
ncbi:MAG: hypothetical protein QXP72_02760 [Desulfurococcaceae archaeon]